MKTTQAAYFTAYHSLRLSRDTQGVLVVESAQDHTEFVDAFYRIAQDRANKIVVLTRSGGGIHPRD